MKENIKETSQIVLLLHLCTLASALVINFLQYFKGTRVHELNKNDMKLELASCHESTTVNASLPVNACLIYLYIFLLEVKDKCFYL